MNLPKYVTGTAIMLVSGSLLFADGWLHWNKVKGLAIQAGGTVTFSTAWSSGVGPFLLIFLILTLQLVLIDWGIASGKLKMTLPSLPIEIPQLIAGLAALTAIFGIIRVFQSPGFSGAPVPGIGTSVWGWIGFVLLIVFALGAVLRVMEGEKAKAGAAA